MVAARNHAEGILRIARQPCIEPGRLVRARRLEADTSALARSARFGGAVLIVRVGLGNPSQPTE